MNLLTLITNLFGLAGMITSALLFQQKKRRNMLLWKLVSDLFWIIHYILLGGYSGAAVMVVSAFRSAVFLKYEHPGKGWLAVFLSVSLALSIAAWKDMFSLLPLLCSFNSIIAFWIGVPKVTRIMLIPASLLYLIYNVSCGSVEGTLSEGMAVVSAVAGVIRLDILKQKPEKEA